ncbi:MAG: metal ABC transporter substrate-binding protein [Deltaproteobacteria bacterium]|nr:metal ABC transporter substrate-binding protein [Deltaproteobacteria bacterium]
MTLRQLALPILFVAMLAPGGARADALRVVATTPDLADLARQVGGDAVEVTSLAKGPQDVHFVEPRPSFVKELHRAELLIRVGMGLESGWLPPLLGAARNPRIQRGAAGSLDASTAIVPREVPQARVDRSMGDVHPFGNPHYLPDPLNGLRVAGAIRDRLSALRPDQARAFAARYHAFAARLVERLVGAELAGQRTPAEIAAAVEAGRLPALVAEAGASLGGWLGAIGTGPPRKAVEDHRAWIYLAERFGLELVAALEPLPGIAPTTRQLQEVVEQMQAERVNLILSTPYFSPRHAEFVAERTGARIVELAHQTGSRPGTDDYLATVDFNVRALVGAR